MKKVKEFFRKNGTYFTLGTIGLFLLFSLCTIFFWMYPPFLEIRSKLFITILCICLINIPIMILSDLKLVCKIILPLSIFPIWCCTAIIFAFRNPYDVLTSIEFEGSKYYLVERIANPPDDDYCELYKCDLRGSNCESIDDSRHSHCYDKNHIPTFVIDLENNELQLIYSYLTNIKRLLLSYQNSITRYDHYHRIEDGNIFYYLAYTPNGKNSGSDWDGMLFECNKDHSSCNRIPFLYPSNFSDFTGGRLHLHQENETGEISITESNTLIYTYDGETGTCHVDGCSLID